MSLAASPKVILDAVTDNEDSKDTVTSPDAPPPVRPEPAITRVISPIAAESIHLYGSSVGDTFGLYAST